VLRRERLRVPRALVAALALILLLGTACAGLRSAFEDSPLPSSAREIYDIPYRKGSGFDRLKHRLDLFVPPGAEKHPVLIFVHGGSWRTGDRHAAAGVYRRLGRRFANKGILTAVISYRLAPDNKHPASVRDVARAIAAVMRNAERYGGDRSRVFIMGHSAGAHLVALAACDPEWLFEARVDTRSIAGVIGISGPYDVARLGKEAPGLVGSVFSAEPSVWSRASPATYLGHRSVPPFLVAWANDDPESLRAQGRVFADALKANGTNVKEVVAEERNHFTVIMRLGASDDPLGEEVRRFIQETPPATFRPPPARAAE
jgi:acetyl esterase/lipase